MKILATLSLLILLTHPALADKLSFEAPEMEVKQVMIKKDLPTNLIRLYQRMPSERRMIAGFKEVKTVSSNSWLDGLRTRIKSSNGQPVRL